MITFILGAIVGALLLHTTDPPPPAPEQTADPIHQPSMPPATAQPAHDIIELTAQEQQAWHTLTAEFSTDSTAPSASHSNAQTGLSSTLHRLAQAVVKVARQLLDWASRNHHDLISWLDGSSGGRVPRGWQGVLHFLIQFSPSFAR